MQSFSAHCQKCQDVREIRDPREVIVGDPHRSPWWIAIEGDCPICGKTLQTLPSEEALESEDMQQKVERHQRSLKFYLSMLNRARSQRDHLVLGVVIAVVIVVVGFNNGWWGVNPRDNNEDIYSVERVVGDGARAEGFDDCRGGRYDPTFESEGLLGERYISDYEYYYEIGCKDFQDADWAFQQGLEDGALDCREDELYGSHYFSISELYLVEHGDVDAYERGYFEGFARSGSKC